MLKKIIGALLVAPMVALIIGAPIYELGLRDGLIVLGVGAVFVAITVVGIFLLCD